MIKITAAHMKKSGGPGIFMNRLLSYMQDKDMVRVVDAGADIYFSTVLGKPPKGMRFVYRAAAAYYDTIHQKKRHGFNLKIAKLVKRADFVIYQSKFAKKMVESILRVKAKKSTIICNGVKSCLPTSGDRDPLLFVASANWSVPGKRGKHIIKSFKKAAVPGSRLIMLGSGVKNKSSRIRCWGRVSFEKIAKVLSCSPTFIHLCYAEACPNAVIEALSFGCPVICNNIGATPEIVGDSGIIVKCDKPFVFRRRPVNLKIKTDRVAKAIRDSVHKEWKVDRPDLQLSISAEKYLNVFRKVLK